MRKIISISVTVLMLSFAANAQQPKMNTILYGASFYEEYQPSDRLEEDVKLMQDAGMNVVRLGESTWSLWEPEEGRFEFAWMDRIIDRLHKANIKVILGTPTYSIPAWLYRKHPEILAVRPKEQKAFYGFRQNMDIVNPTYLFYCERVIRKMMEHYAKHPAIIGYQVDNETSTYNAYNRDMFIGFVDFMKDKYITTANVNKLWGMQYWGQTYNDWDEFTTRDDPSSPSYKLEWERYEMKVTADFLNWQVSIIKEYKRPGQFVTHDFTTGFTDVDHFSCARHMEYLAVNPYHEMQKGLDGEMIAYCGDFFRSIKGNNYLVTETNAQTIGWDSKGQYPPYDGQSRLCVYSHLARGANMVEYWHWHSLHYGQETYWKGVLSHDNQPNRVYREMSKTAHELQKIGPKLVNLKIKNKVAILYSKDSHEALNFMPVTNPDGGWWGSSYPWKFVKQLHMTLYKNNIGTDFIFTEKPNFKDYQLVIIPALYVATDSLLNAISDYVKNGGHVIMTFKSGFCTEYNSVRPVMAPGPLRQACGFYYQEFQNIDKVKLKDNPYGVADDDNYAQVWAEYIIPETAKTLAWYDDKHLPYPAVTENKFGKGSLIYEGCFLSNAIQEKIILNKAKEIGLAGVNQVKFPVIMSRGTNDAGKTVVYLLNFSDENQKVNYPGNAGTSLISGSAVAAGLQIELAPWDVMIVEEK